MLLLRKIGEIGREVVLGKEKLKVSFGNVNLKVVI